MKILLTIFRWLLVAPSALFGWLLGYFVYRSLYLLLRPLFLSNEWAMKVHPNLWVFHNWFAAFLCVLFGALMAPKLKRAVGITLGVLACAVDVFEILIQKPFWTYMDSYPWEMLALAIFGDMVSIVLAILITSGPFRAPGKPDETVEDQ